MIPTIKFILVLIYSLFIPLTAQECALDDDFAAFGTVYTMTNSEEGNEILVYERSFNGMLTLSAAYSTVGFGVGSSTVPGDALGSQGPLILSSNNEWLIACNAKSDEISLFQVEGRR